MLESRDILYSIRDYGSVKRRQRIIQDRTTGPDSNSRRADVAYTIFTAFDRLHKNANIRVESETVPQVHRSAGRGGAGVVRRAGTPVSQRE